LDNCESSTNLKFKSEFDWCGLNLDDDTSDCSALRNNRQLALFK